MGVSESLYETLNSYLHKLESLNESLPALMAMAYVSRRIANAKKLKFLNEHGELIEDTGEEKKFRLDLEHQRLAERLDRKVRRATTAFEVLPGKFLVAFVSEYDAFLGGLIKSIYRAKPELLDGSEKNLSFSELKEIGSIEAAYEHILEKEVENLLRKSHSDQFDWLENKFGIPLKKGLDSWSTFIELTERRNLLVHCDGVVSKQYVAVCKKHHANIDGGPNAGDRLVTSKDYLANAYRCLYEIGTKLTNVLWRKVFPDEIAGSDESLIKISYNLIHEEDYELAKRLLDFSVVTLKKWSSDSRRRILVINRAQTYYHTNDHKECGKILGHEDWTACGYEFQICVAVLKKDYDKALRLMRTIGNNGVVSEVDYIDWPVFRDFRASEQFITTFKEIFNKEPKNIANIAEEVDVDALLGDDLHELKEDLMEKFGQAK